MSEVDERDIWELQRRCDELESELTDAQKRIKALERAVRQLLGVNE